MSCTFYGLRRAQSGKCQFDVFPQLWDVHHLPILVIVLFLLPADDGAGLAGRLPSARCVRARRTDTGDTEIEVGTFHMKRIISAETTSPLQARTSSPAQVNADSAKCLRCPFNTRTNSRASIYSPSSSTSASMARVALDFEACCPALRGPGTTSGASSLAMVRAV